MKTVQLPTYSLMKPVITRHETVKGLDGDMGRQCITNLGEPREDVEACAVGYALQGDRNTLKTTLELLLARGGSTEATGDISLGYHRLKIWLAIWRTETPQRGNVGFRTTAIARAQ